MTGRTLRCGMIGANISRSRFPRAFEIMAEAASLALDYEAIDTEGRRDFDFDACVADLIARAVSRSAPRTQASRGPPLKTQAQNARRSARGTVRLTPGRSRPARAARPPRD